MKPKSTSVQSNDGTQAMSGAGYATQLSLKASMRRTKEQQIQAARLRVALILKHATWCDSRIRTTVAPELREFRAQRARLFWRHYDKLTLWLFRAEGHSIELPGKN